MIRRPVSPLWLAAGASLWMAATGNGPLWSRLSGLGLLQRPQDVAFAGAMFLIIWACLAAFLCLLAWRLTLKPAITMLFVSAAVAGHFMASYGVVMDPSMLLNAMQTDVAEAGALMNWRLLVRLLALAVLPAWLVWRQPVIYGPTMRQLWRNPLAALAALAFLVATVFASFQPLAATMRNHKDVRYLLNPVASVYSVVRVALKSFERDESTLLPIAQDAHLGRPATVATERPRLLVLVLGETARSANFGLNGYERQTTPRLASHGVVSFTNAWSCGTSTAESVPCMFSHLTRDEFGGRKSNYENLLDVLQRAGLAVLWIDNQSGCKGVCDRIPSVSTVSAENAQLCASGQCLDHVMLDGLDERIQALDPERRERGVVVVMHQMGSHGPAYYKRSPPESKLFLAECTTNALQECSRESVVNAYDNSIVYTDRFLGSVIDWLQARQSLADAAMVYVSDHGESLGENNVYLHGLPYAFAPDHQKHVPWITWISDGFKAVSALSTECLHKGRDLPFSHDHYFHSVLGLMAVQTGAYQPGMDAYARCRSNGG
ncbi:MULTISPECIES: phosphoethanolamine--lipid A transferase [unclassified Acidovorax]|uniref:phosphoethanolamine transferase n=1 Tax=unclassified Acidovorax TaxID=2684926 RepID=UPI0023DE5ADD|nr:MULTISPECIES: phosphoethanolamine--lipid A transferase [unclassified Acidovorax]GKS92830.1 phosphoethanolamine--lipid A transferase [Acidovorax sp. SUPP2539]GKS97566.1 phosphoethanolamine--lipid A transferase [Acidovorax sp. SUPP2825]